MYHNSPELSPSSVHAETSPSSVHAETSPSSVHAETSPSSVHAETSPSSVHAETSPSSVHAETSPSSVHAETSPSSVHAETSPSSVHAEAVSMLPSLDSDFFNVELCLCYLHYKLSSYTFTRNLSEMLVSILKLVSTLSVCSHEQPITMCVGVFCTCELNVVSDARFYNMII